MGNGETEQGTGVIEQEELLEEGAGVEKSEGAEDKDVLFPDGSGDKEEDALIDETIEDGEANKPKFTPTQWNGLLRDKQLSDQARQDAQAELAALKIEHEKILNQNKATENKPKLSEEEAEALIDRGTLNATLDSFGDKLIEKVTGILSERETKTAETTRKQQMTESATRVKNTRTVKTMGQGLDADTVVNGTAAWLATNKPELFKAMQESSTFPEDLYEYGIMWVPQFKKLYQTRVNALNAKRLQSHANNDFPAGSSMPASAEKGKIINADNLLEGMLSGEIDPAKAENLFVMN